MDFGEKRFVQTNVTCMGAFSLLTEIGKLHQGRMPNDNGVGYLHGKNLLFTR